MQGTQPSLPGIDTLFDDAACGLLLTGTDGLILKANQTFCQWLGHPSHEIVGRRHLQDLLTLEGRAQHIDGLAPLQAQSPVAGATLEFAHRDGQRVPMMLNAARCEHAGAVYHHLALFKLAEQAPRAIATFAEQMIGLVSHDLRNPLTAIHMGTHLLESTELTPKQHLVLSRIDNATQRAHRLIADLLDFTVARLGQGLPIRRSAFDLHDLVASRMAELQAAFPATPWVHERRGDGQVEGDADRLAQLVSNLGGNAVAHGDRTRAVTVTSSVGADSYGLAVHNHGAPIPDDVLPTLFEPMVRGGSSRGSRRRVGLGLFIVSEIVRAHHGRLSATSTASSGTVFEATFPHGPSPSTSA